VHKELKLHDDSLAEVESQDESHESHEEEPSSKIKKKSCGCKPILVADDNEFNLYTFQSMMLNY